LNDDAPDESAPGRDDLEALRIVEEAAAEHWRPLPHKPDMAVPASAAGIRAVRSALEEARELGPQHPDTLRRLSTFEGALDWATQNRFSGSLAVPLGAVGIAILLVVGAFAEGRLPGTRDELLLYAGLLVIQASLYRLCARRPQFEINAHFLTDNPSRDERLVRWLLSKGALIFTPVALLRALLFGLLIPGAMVRHLVRRGLFFAVALVLFANFAVVFTGRGLPRGLVAEEADPFEAGIDIFGHWVPADDPLSAPPADAERRGDTGWALRRSDPEGGLEANVWVHRGQLGDSSMRVWASPGASPQNKYLQRYRRSAAQLERTWGEPVSARSETNETSGCLTRWLSYERSGIRLSLKENECQLGERRTLNRSISAPVVAR
jgi:hypothetical protein